MRLAFALVLLLTLAACGGAAPPTATPTATLVPSPQPTEPPTRIPFETPNPNRILAQTVVMPVPGTLEVPGGYGVERAFEFNSLSFTQSRADMPTPLSLQLLGDGTLTRNGVSSRATDEQMDQIRAQLGAINFFEMQGIFTGPGASGTAYSYSLTVDGAPGSRTIYAQDGLIPPELMEVFNVLLELGM